MPAVDERRGAAAVEVDRLTRAEREKEACQLAEVEAGVDAGPAAVAADREELVVADAERAAGIAPDRDVGVELPRAAGEALAVVAVHDGPAVMDQQRPGLDEIAGRVGGERVARREDHLAVDVDARPSRVPR